MNRPKTPAPRTDPKPTNLHRAVPRLHWLGGVPFERHQLTRRASAGRQEQLDLRVVGGRRREQHPDAGDALHVAWLEVAKHDAVRSKQLRLLDEANEAGTDRSWLVFADVYLLDKYLGEARVLRDL